jgi:hypothetical protein
MNYKPPKDKAYTASLVATLDKALKEARWGLSGYTDKTFNKWFDCVVSHIGVYSPAEWTSPNPVGNKKPSGDYRETQIDKLKDAIQIRVKDASTRQELNEFFVNLEKAIENCPTCECSQCVKPSTNPDGDSRDGADAKHQPGGLKI